MSYHKNIKLVIFANIVLFFTCANNDFDPKGAWPALSTNNYKEKGKVFMLGDLPIYEVGKGSKVIIYSYDIHGFNSGRTRELCDHYADNGYHVVMADYFRGNFPGNPNANFNANQFSWPTIYSDLYEKVFPYLEQQSHRQFVMIGTCFGGWVTLEASLVTPNVIGIITFHPVAAKVSGNLKDLGDELNAPILLIASHHEPSLVKEGGIVEKRMKARFPDSVFKTYENMLHGFVTRGNIEDPEVRQAVHEAVELSLKFLEKIYSPDSKKK